MLKMQYRKLALAPGGPVTVDEATRSVEVVGATETAIPERDYESWDVFPTIITMAGCQMPASRQIPLLDTHSRYSTASVIGSYREMRIEGENLVGRATFSAAPEAEGAWLKTREGHLTDYSVGRLDEESTIIPAGQSAVVAGRSYTGPVRVVTKWKPKEMSVCPIGADENAKARADQPEPQKTKENTAMNRELRAFLERRGLSVTATDAEAIAFMETLDVKREAVLVAAAPAVDVEAVRAEATGAEHARITEIAAMCLRFDVPAERQAELAKPGVSVDAARKAVMDEIQGRAALGTPAFRPAIEVGTEEKEKFRSASLDALCMRGGLVVEKPAVGAQDLMGYSLREMARRSLELAGQASGGNVMEMVGRAMTTSDFPNILANAANKSLFAGYDTNQETWNQWCATGSTPDFKTNTLASLSESDDLEQITDSQPYEYGKKSDAKEQYAVATYGKLFAITRQSIINDDLNSLVDLPRSHGEAASRKVGDVAYAVLTANAAMRDGTALFHANHANLGAAGVISVTTIGEAEKLMGLQKDLLGKRRLNIRPQFFLAPLTVKMAAETFFKTVLIGGVANQVNLQNIYADAFTRIYEPRLDDSSTTAYYLAGPKGKTVTVFFLNGLQAPYMETKQGWSVDGVEYKVRIDCGAKAVDWKGMVKNAG